MKKIVKIILIAISTIVVLLILMIALFKLYHWWLSAIQNKFIELDSDLARLQLIMHSDSLVSIKECNWQKDESCNLLKKLDLELCRKFTTGFRCVENKKWWSSIPRYYIFDENGISEEKDFNRKEMVNFKILDKNWATYTPKPFL